MPPTVAECIFIVISRERLPELNYYFMKWDGRKATTWVQTSETEQRRIINSKAASTSAPVHARIQCETENMDSPSTVALPRERQQCSSQSKMHRCTSKCQLFTVDTFRATKSGKKEELWLRSPVYAVLVSWWEIAANLELIATRNTNGKELFELGKRFRSVSVLGSGSQTLPANLWRRQHHSMLYFAVVNCFFYFKT